MKKIIVFIVSLFSAVLSLSARDIYSDADKSTKEVLAQVDDLIEKEQYESAFGRLSAADTNEYILTKRVEVACTYFAQSMMHQLFAFKNLEKGETLYDVRTGEGSFNLIMFDPVEAVESYVKENGEKPILDYALGFYYQDVIDRYYDKWLLTLDELNEKVALHFQKALDKGCYDEYSLSWLATAYYGLDKNEDAIRIYEAKEKEFKFTPTDNYHYGILMWQNDNSKKGVEYVKKSIDGYKDMPGYQADAYVVTGLIYISLKDYKNAEKYFNKCKKEHPDDYRPLQYGVRLYALQNQSKKLVSTAMELYAIAPENPKTCQMIMEECENAGKAELALDFFKEAVKKYEKNSEACENLYFHYAFQNSFLGNAGEAAKLAATARSYFEKNGHLDDDIAEMLDSLIYAK